MERELGDLKLREAVTMHQYTTVGSVTVAVAIVIVDDRGDPQAVLPAELLAEQPRERRLADLLGSLPPILVADHATPISVLKRQISALELDDHDSLVVVGRTGNIVGVLVGPRLTKQLSRVHVYSDRGVGLFPAPRLPGPVKVPKIVRSCQYQHVRTLCGDRRSFDVKPSTMPPCVDPKHLGAHPFAW
jgi:hypothetical protein